MKFPPDAVGTRSGRLFNVHSMVPQFMPWIPHRHGKRYFGESSSTTSTSQNRIEVPVKTVGRVETYASCDEELHDSLLGTRMSAYIARACLHVRKSR